PTIKAVVGIAPFSIPTTVCELLVPDKSPPAVNEPPLEGLTAGFSKSNSAAVELYVIQAWIFATTSPIDGVSPPQSLIVIAPRPLTFILIVAKLDVTVGIKQYTPLT